MMNSNERIQPTVNSSKLIEKLESVNWCFPIQVLLNGIKSTLLVKYLCDEEYYAIMVSDFSCIYFECSFGSEIDQLYYRYNKHKLPHEDIIGYLDLMLQVLPSSLNRVEKLQIDCHTTRITFRCTKKITVNFHFNWNFHIISTDPDIFLKHFSMPLFRGLTHYYNLYHLQKQTMQPQLETNQSSQKLDSTTGDENPDTETNPKKYKTVSNSNKPENVSNNQERNMATKNEFALPLPGIDHLNEDILNDIFRFDNNGMDH